MTKHTPGPWRAGQDGNNRVYGPDGMGEHSGLIAAVYKGRGNVRLIAAAPELLDAVEQLLIGMDMGWDLVGLAEFARSAATKAGSDIFTDEAA